MASHVETEFKLRTTRSLEVARVDAAVRESTFTCDHASSRRHNDIYLDDSRRSLAHSGLGLRVRIDNGRSTICCKERGSREGAKFVREEHEANWPSPTTPPTAAALPADLRDAIEPITLRRPLIPVLRLDVTRELRALSLDGEAVCELAVDRVDAHGAGRSVRFSEIELEVLDDLPSCEELADRLGRALDVNAASNDKPTHAARLLGLPHPAPNALDPETPTSAAVQALCECGIAGMQLAESRVRQDSSPRNVHRMRVAARRLRTLASAFASVWPAEQARWMRAHLRALTAELGRVRDLDVMLATLHREPPHLPEALHPAIEHLIGWLERTANEARNELGEWLRSSGRLDDTQRFVELVPHFDSEHEIGEPPIGEFARNRLAKYATKLRRRTRNLNTATPTRAFHRARVATKRLRYLADELADLAVLDLGKLNKRLRRLQRTLGELCDADTALARLQLWTPRILAEVTDEPMIGPALGAVMQRRWQEIAKHRQSALDAARRERRRLRLPG
ncbi:MAG: CHAD domain-containing protein [bacterium]|nr:CHAD domain-containing protein [bacterium]